MAESTESAYPNYRYDRVSGWTVDPELTWPEETKFDEIANELGYKTRLYDLGSHEEVMVFEKAGAPEYLALISFFEDRTTMVAIKGLPSLLAFLQEMSALVKMLDEQDARDEALRQEALRQKAKGR